CHRSVAEAKAAVARQHSMREGRLPLSSRVNVLGERSRSDETQSKIKNLKSRIGLRFLQASTGFDLPILPHEPSGKGMGVSDEPSPLSTPFHKYDHVCCVDFRLWRGATRERSEEHTSELQSLRHLVCRLLLEK